MIASNSERANFDRIAETPNLINRRKPGQSFLKVRTQSLDSRPGGTLIFQSPGRDAGRAESLAQHAFHVTLFWGARAHILRVIPNTINPPAKPIKWAQNMARYDRQTRFRPEVLIRLVSLAQVVAVGQTSDKFV